MRWLKPNLRSSIYSLLGNPLPPSESILRVGVEEIRESMLMVLGDDGPTNYPQIVRRVRYANDVQVLWYLRGELMATLAATHGEMVAREKIRSITPMFHGLLPNGLSSRSSPLVA